MIIILVAIVLLLLMLATSAYSGSAENLIIYVISLSAMEGYDPNTRMLEKFAERKGYQLTCYNEDSDIINVIKENKRTVVGLAIDVNIYLFADKKYMHKARLTTAKGIIEYLSTLEDKTLDGRLRVSPTSTARYLFESKLYLKHFEEDYPELYLPHTKTFVDSDKADVEKCANALLDEFPKIVVKKGFSSDSRGVEFISEKSGVSDAVDKLYTKMVIGDYSYDPADFESGCSRVMVVQPHNEQIDNSCGFLYIADKFTGYIFCGTSIVKYDPEQPHHKTAKNIADDAFGYAKMRAGWMRLMQVCVAYSVDQKCQDSHSLEIDGEMRRYYVADLNITPSLGFTRIQDEAESKVYQEKIMGSIVDSIIESIKS